MALKKYWKEYRAAQKIADALDARWDAGEDVETEWDAAYKAEHEAFARVAAEIAALIKVDQAIARIMILKDEEKIENLINRLA